MSNGGASTTKTPTGGAVKEVDKPKASLILIGFLIMLLAAGGVVYARAAGSETVEKTVPATGGVTTAQSGDATSSAPASTAPTEKTTTTKTAPSDTLLTALFGIGALLVLTGFLYGRLSSITLPGGSKLDFASLTKEEVEQTTKAVTEASGLDSAKDLPSVLANVSAAKAAVGSETLSDATIDSLVSAMDPAQA